MSDSKKEPTLITVSLDIDLYGFLHRHNVPVAEIPALEQMLGEFLNDLQGVVARTEARLEALYLKRN